MPIDPREGLFEYAGFTGLRNNTDPRNFTPADLVDAINCDVDDGNNIDRRYGFGAVVAAGIDRNLFATGPICLGVGSNALKQMSTAYGLTTLRSSLTPGRDLSYAPVADRVYYSNGVERGCVQNGADRSWGIDPPALPLAALTAGDLDAGTYQFVVTYIRNDGQESGAVRAGTYVLAARGGIALSAIPVSTDATIVGKAVYVSTRNGSALYRLGLIPNATTTFAIRELGDPAAPLTTQFLTPPLAGDLIAYFKGQMLVARGNRLYPSQAYAPELFDLRKAIPFLDRITMLAPLNNKTDGIWIGTDSQVIWINVFRPMTASGEESSDKWEYKVSADYGVIPGTMFYADGELLGDGSGAGEQCVYFTTKRGICVGRTGGAFVNLTQEKFNFPAQPAGAGVVRRHRGIVQYLCTLNGPETAANTFT